MSENENRPNELGEYAGQEEYTLYSRDRIVSTLKEISKRPDIVTAYYSGGKHNMLTAVLGVLPERGIVVLDYGPDETRNRLMLESERVVCLTKHEGIAIRFSLSGLTKAKFQGRDVFAAPLPESVLRLQRREFFRVHTPIINPVTCRVPRPEGKDLSLVVIDMSVGGVGVIDHTLSLDTTPLVVLPNCMLILPEFDSIPLDLEIRNSCKVRHRDGNEVLRIGCRFVSLRGDRAITVQRYINKLQVERRASRPDD